MFGVFELLIKKVEINICKKSIEFQRLFGKYRLGDIDNNNSSVCG